MRGSHAGETVVCRLLLAVLAGLAGCGDSATEEVAESDAQGTIVPDTVWENPIVPAKDWHNQWHETYDSLAGVWHSEELGLRIFHDEGLFSVTPFADPARQEEYLWFKTGVYKGEEFNYALRENDGNGMHLFVSFIRPYEASSFNYILNLSIWVKGDEDMDSLVQHMLERSRARVTTREDERK